MKISFRWLCEYVDIKGYKKNPEAFYELFSRSGLELDGVENLSKINICVGELLSVKKHPNADRLSVCEVQTSKGVLKIVCGAKNHKEGDKVVVALPGCELPNGLVIKTSKIRDVESSGMLCAPEELGLDQKSEGIWILPKDTPLNHNIKEELELEDIILDLSVTPNRADCLSHRGLARELSLLLGKPFKTAKPKLKTKALSLDSSLKVSLQDKKGCSRYIGRWVEGVKIKPSPSWLKNRLRNLGLNSLNNVVDITNLVMMEYGHPLHSFDGDKLSKKVAIGPSKAKESFVTLDGTKLNLSGKELVIRDEKGILALAGVIGGKGSGVTESTKNIFLEVAHFEPSTVRKSSRRFGIETESSYRFSRGVDLDLMREVMDRACELITKEAGGVVSKTYHDVGIKKEKLPKISISPKEVEERLGYKVLDTEFKKLSKWNFHLKKKGKSYEVTPPSYRKDIHIKEDIIEECARLKGYDKIPETLPPSTPLTLPQEKFGLRSDLLNALKGEGFFQVYNYYFLNKDLQEEFLKGVDLDGKGIFLENPLSKDQEVMRQTLLPLLFKNLLHNYRHGLEYGRLFEMGPIFFKKGEIEERLKWSFAAWGQKDLLWQKEGGRPLIYDVKSHAENILHGLRIKPWSWNFDKKAPDFIHEARYMELFCGKNKVGFVGNLHPLLQDKYKIRKPVVLCEMDVSPFLELRRRLKKATPPSRFPVVTRDFTFLVPQDVRAGEVLKTFERSLGDDLKKVSIVDTFKEDEEKRAITYRFLFQSQEKTLSENRLQELQSSIQKKAEEVFSIKIKS